MCNFLEVKKHKDALNDTVTDWKTFKDETERLSDWMLQSDADIKAYKTIMVGTLKEKEDQVKNMQVRTNFKPRPKLNHTFFKSSMENFKKASFSAFCFL